MENLPKNQKPGVKQSAQNKKNPKMGYKSKKVHTSPFTISIKFF